MNLQEIIKYNQNYEIESQMVRDKLFSMQQHIQNINNNINLDEFEKLSYTDAKEIHKLLCSNISDKQMKVDLTDILNQLKQSEYPQLTKAHYYPVINEMDFLSDIQKVEFDKYLKGLYSNFIHTTSSAWYKLGFNKEIEEKVLSFLCDKGIIEKSYVIDCGCGSSECDGRRVSQDGYNEFVRFHSLTPNDTENMSDEELVECEQKGYISVPCWNDGGKEIYDLDTFMREIKLFSYANITKPDISLDEV